MNKLREITILHENFPYSLNNEFRGYIMSNFKSLNRERKYLKDIIIEHTNEKDAHTSDQINHGNKPLNEVVDVLEGRINNQIYGASKNSSAEVKDLRVGMDGEVHDLAQDRFMSDLGKIDNVANATEKLAKEHEKKMEESAFYNEISTVQGRKFNTSYYITHIPNKDKDGNFIKLKKGINGTSGKDIEHLEPSEYSKIVGATFVSNASTGSGSQQKLHGQQIYNGQILDSIKDDEYEPIKDRWTLAIGDDNTLEAFPQNITAKEIKAKGYNNTVSGFGPIISGNKVVVKDDNDYSPNTVVKHPRTVIAQLPNKDILFFVCDGRENNNQGFIEEGMTLREVADTLYDHYGEIEFAYNMDGGGSSSNVVRHHKINKSMDERKTKERKVLDFLYISKEKVQPRDTDIQKAYEDIGELKNMLQKVYGELYSFNRTSRKEFGITGYDKYTGYLSFDEEGNPKKKFYMGTEGFRMFDYDTGRTWFRVLPDFMQFMGKALATNYSAPPLVTDLNNIELGGTYYAQRSAKGSPYPNASSCVVTQYNITYSLKDDDVTAFQFAVPFARTQNVRMKRRTYAEGKWSQWFDV